MSASTSVDNNSPANTDTTRRELENYLVYIENKLGSDGKPLVAIPSNFNKVADSMNRDDLNSTKRPWSQFLFQENFDKILHEEFGGRYDGLLSDSDAKINKGLAQIQLLDRQLQGIMKAEIKIKPDQDIEETFITKTGEYDNVTSRSNPSVVHVNQHVASSSVASRLAVENRRLWEILEADDEVRIEQDEYLQTLKTMEHENELLDQQLSQYGRLDRLRLPDNERDSVDADFVTQQRILRKAKERVATLDAQLRASSQQSIDLRGLVGDCHRSHRAALPNRGLAVPELKEVRVDKAVTMNDVVALLSSLSMDEAVAPTKAICTLLERHRDEVDTLSRLRRFADVRARLSHPEIASSVSRTNDSESVEGQRREDANSDGEWDRLPPIPSPGDDKTVSDSMPFSHHVLQTSANEKLGNPTVFRLQHPQRPKEIVTSVPPLRVPTDREKATKRLLQEQKVRNILNNV